MVIELIVNHLNVRLIFLLKHTL